MVGEHVRFLYSRAVKNQMGITKANYIYFEFFKAMVI